MTKWTDDDREAVREILASRRGTREQRVDAILAALGSELIGEAYPERTHAEVERVEAYGLVLGIDANGHACRIEFPWGADTDG